jgi:hypothetical protein
MTDLTALIRRTTRPDLLARDPRTAPHVEGYAATDLGGCYIGTFTTLASAKNFIANGREAAWVWTRVADDVWTGRPMTDDDRDHCCPACLSPNAGTCVDCSW